MKRRRNLNNEEIESRRSRLFSSTHMSELFESMNLNTCEYRDEGRIKSTVTVFFEKRPHPTIMNTLMILMCMLFLLAKHVYPRIDSNGWTSIVPVIEFLRGETFRSVKEDVFGNAICNSITLLDRKINDGKIRELEVIAPILWRQLSALKERYELHKIYSIGIHVYSERRLEEVDIKSDEAVISELDKLQILEKVHLYGEDKMSEEELGLNIKKTKTSKYPEYITKLRNKNKIQRDQYLTKKAKDPKWRGRMPDKTIFMVADIETIMLYPEDYKEVVNQNPAQIPNKRHYPYAASFMVVDPKIKLKKVDVQHCFSHEFESTYPSFYDQSEQVLRTFIKKILSEGRKIRKTPIIYFHNMSRFDGILLAQHLTTHHKHEWTIEPNMRNGTMYELSVYKTVKSTPDKDQASGNRLLFRLRCSLLILPLSLEELANQMLAKDDRKYHMDHSAVTLESLNNKDDYILYKDYLGQDVYILGQIMRKTQDFFWNNFMVDIVNHLTIASLALKIFRTDYYDDDKHRMYIPNGNADKFIRDGYMGGRSDVFIPSGEDLYAYDVNSLYPSVMVGNKMPGGKPVWHPDLTQHKLEDIFGFVEAVVWCDDKEERPYLPTRRAKEGTLLFPVGNHFGVYFTEELKYAEKLGYTVTLGCGYLFEPMDSPFDTYVKDLYERRMKAKENEDSVGALLFKLLLNNLYGRLAINPECTLTKIMNTEEAALFIRQNQILNSQDIGADMNIVTYVKNAFDPRGPWVPPMNASPQISAAITGYARIFMYPHISRPDCLYTDTDSVILQNPLPEEWVSSKELGKFKQEHGGIIRRGVFIAPKCYFLELSRKKKDKDGNELNEYEEIIKYKGAPKGMVKADFFKAHAKDITHTHTLTYENLFTICFKTFTIYKHGRSYLLKVNSVKRIPVLDKTGKIWVGTKPIRLSRNEFQDQLRRSTRSGILLTELSVQNAELRERMPKKSDQSEIPKNSDDSN